MLNYLLHQTLLWTSSRSHWSSLSAPVGRIIEILKQSLHLISEYQCCFYWLHNTPQMHNNFYYFILSIGYGLKFRKRFITVLDQNLYWIIVIYLIRSQLGCVIIAINIPNQMCLKLRIFWLIVCVNLSGYTKEFIILSFTEERFFSE